MVATDQQGLDALVFEGVERLSETLLGHPATDVGLGTRGEHDVAELVERQPTNCKHAVDGGQVRELWLAELNRVAGRPRWCDGVVRQLHANLAVEQDSCELLNDLSHADSVVVLDAGF